MEMVFQVLSVVISIFAIVITVIFWYLGKENNKETRDMLEKSREKLEEISVVANKIENSSEQINKNMEMHIKNMMDKMPSSKERQQEQAMNIMAPMLEKALGDKDMLETLVKLGQQQNQSKK